MNPLIKAYWEKLSSHVSFPSGGEIRINELIYVGLLLDPFYDFSPQFLIDYILSEDFMVCLDEAIEKNKPEASFLFDSQLAFKKKNCFGIPQRIEQDLLFYHEDNIITWFKTLSSDVINSKEKALLRIEAKKRIEEWLKEP